MAQLASWRATTSRLLLDSAGGGWVRPSIAANLGEDYPLPLVNSKPDAPERSNRDHRVTIANLLMAFGVMIILVVGGLYAYGKYEEGQYARQSELRLLAFEQERAVLEQRRQGPNPTATREATSVPVAEPARATAQTRYTPVPPPSATPTARPLPARRITIPAIEVDSEVVESELKNGEWQVPKFVVGHLAGTPYPSQAGNSVYSGHLKSISSGNIFERLAELRVGDKLSLFTAEAQYQYAIAQTKIVANNDLSVLEPTAEPTVTLITCAGEWDFVKRDYPQRLIVIAKLITDRVPVP